MYKTTTDYWVEIIYADGSVERKENMTLNEACELQSKMKHLTETTQHRAMNDKHIVADVLSGRN